MYRLSPSGLIAGCWSLNAVLTTGPRLTGVPHGPNDPSGLHRSSTGSRVSLTDRATGRVRGEWGSLMVKSFRARAVCGTIRPRRADRAPDRGGAEVGPAGRKDSIAHVAHLLRICGSDLNSSEPMSVRASTQLRPLGGPPGGGRGQVSTASRSGRAGGVPTGRRVPGAGRRRERMAEAHADRVVPA